MACMNAKNAVLHIKIKKQQRNAKIIAENIKAARLKSQKEQ